MLDFSIKKILPHVYHLHFGSGYQAAMHFLRVQEYYESPKFHGKIFSLVEYMEWYAKDSEKGAFTYPVDWSGFNVPSRVLLKVYSSSTNIPDFNKYDEFMSRLVAQAHYEEGNELTNFKRSDGSYDFTESQPFYFIGTSDEGHGKGETADDILDHEIAHALYTVDPKYQENVNRLLGEWNGPGSHKGEELDSARTVLRTMGYHETTVDDEIHAYCATGLCDELVGVISKREMKPFQKLFKEYKKGCKSEM